MNILSCGGVLLSERKKNVSASVLRALSCAALTILLTFLLLLPAALLINKGKLGEEQCSALCALILFLSAALIHVLQRGEKGSGKLWAAILSAVFTSALLLLFSAGLPAFNVVPQRFTVMFISVLVGSLTGTTLKVNFLYKKKQNRKGKYYR